MTLIEIFQCLLELVLLLFKITWNGKIIKGAKRLDASFISNGKLKLAENQAKAKQQPEAEPYYKAKLFALFIHVIIQK